MRGNDTTQHTGQLAEARAARFLEARGLTVLARNVRCRGGELDLVCRDGRTLVFVEVRLRRNPDFGGAAASITTTKQRRVSLAAQHYLTGIGQPDAECRFDCVLFDGGDAPIEWIRHAFDAP